MNAAEALALLAQDAAATFDLSDDGRILGENDPDRSAGPRLFLAGGPGGNLVHLRHDVGDAVAARVLTLFAAEPPWTDPELRPTCLGELTALLSSDAPAEVMGPTVIHALPRGLVFTTFARIVRSETEAGDRLLARLTRDGMPPALAEAGFIGVGDFWAPWCVALVDGQIAAMAFAARTGPRGAAIGVYTFPAFRGRGHAAAATAEWANLPGLADRALFYNALFANTSSVRVIERLGLPRVGISLRIA